MPVLDPAERTVLEDADRQLASLQSALQAAAEADALDPDTVDRLRRTAYELSARVNHSLPPQLDADARDEIRRRLLELLTVGSYRQAPALDVADRVLIEAEALRHVLRDLLQEQPAVELRDAQEVVSLLESWLPAAPVKDLAALLGISERQLQRYRREGGDSSSRMQLVARLVSILRHAWTDMGVLAWFARARSDLAGRTPLDVLDDPAHERDLLLAARAGRVQGAG